MKKVTVSFLAFILIFSLIQSTILAAEGSHSKTDIIGDQLVKNENGASFSVDDFNQNFVGPIEQRKSLNINRLNSTVNIQISDVTISDNNISFNTTIDNETVPFSGSLQASYKSENGVNSIVANLETSSKNYKVLLFEIFNDKNEDNLLIKQNLNGSPHLKFYLQDVNSNILIFEAELPQQFSNLNASTFPKPENSKEEIFWFKGFVKPEETTEIPTEKSVFSNINKNVVTPTALDSFSTWTNPTTYYTAFYVGNDYTQCYSLPYLSYKHVNVTSSDSTWIAQFKIAEHTRVGSYTNYGNNVFEYRNLQLTFGAGDYSTIIRTYQEGRMFDRSTFGGVKQAGSSIAVSLLKKTLSSIPYGNTFYDVLGYINTASSSGGTVTLGNQGVSLAGSYVPVAGQILNSKYKFEESTDHSGTANKGDYFTYHAVLNYEGSGSSSNTVGALRLKFDVYNSENGSTTPISKDFELYYKASKTK